MKLSSILSIFLLLTVCSSTALLGIDKKYKNPLLEELFVQDEKPNPLLADLFAQKDFPTKYIQPKNPLGSIADFNKFDKYGICKKCDLRGFDLRKIIEKHTWKKIDLSGSFCAQANLSNVDLSGANLSGGNFYGSNLKNSNLKDVDAQNAHFPRSYMQNANMQNANLENTNFNNANLNGANLYRAKVNEQTSFTNANCESVDFRKILDLDAANFTGAILHLCKMSSSVSDKMHKQAASVVGILIQK